MSLTYKDAGVNIKAGSEAVSKIKEKVKSTYTNSVLTNLGSFGSAFSLKEIIQNYDDPILIQSTDGVGTKLIIAKMMNKYEGVGIDVVSNNVNDMLCMGAKPITFLDYIGCSHLDPEVMETIVGAMAEECKNSRISLVGGEMAEMPGVYVDGEVDVVGCVTGVVEKSKIIDGSKIENGDVLIGISSSGLHTNGFSLARKVLFEIAGFKANETIPELKESIGETLLKPHVNYTNYIHKILENEIEIKGLSHITGGGFVENIPRILPEGLGVKIDKNSFEIPAIFKVIQKLGEVEEREMFTAFNMGIGMVCVIDKNDAEKVLKTLQEFEFKSQIIGDVVEKEGVEIV